MANKIYSTIGELLKAARLETGKSQEQVTALTGVTQKTISDCENGVYIVTFGTAKKLKDCYKIKIIWSKDGFSYLKTR